MSKSIIIIYFSSRSAENNQKCSKHGEGAGKLKSVKRNKTKGEI